MGVFSSSQSKLPLEIQIGIKDVENRKLRRVRSPLDATWHIREYERAKLMKFLKCTPHLRRIASRESVVFTLYTPRRCRRRRNEATTIPCGAPEWAMRWYVLEQSTHVSEATRSQAALDQKRNAQLFKHGTVPAPPLFECRQSQTDGNPYNLLEI